MTDELPVIPRDDVVRLEGAGETLTEAAARLRRVIASQEDDTDQPRSPRDLAWLQTHEAAVVEALQHVPAMAEKRGWPADHPALVLAATVWQRRQALARRVAKTPDEHEPPAEAYPRALATLAHEAAVALEDPRVIMEGTLAVPWQRMAQRHVGWLTVTTATSAPLVAGALHAPLLWAVASLCLWGGVAAVEALRTWAQFRLTPSGLWLKRFRQRARTYELGTDLREVASLQDDRTSRVLTFAELAHAYGATAAPRPRGIVTLATNTDVPWKAPGLAWLTEGGVLFFEVPDVRPLASPGSPVAQFRHPVAPVDLIEFARSLPPEDAAPLARAFLGTALFRASEISHLATGDPHTLVRLACGHTVRLEIRPEDVGDQLLAPLLQAWADAPRRRSATTNTPHPG